MGRMHRSKSLAIGTLTFLHLSSYILKLPRACPAALYRLIETVCVNNPNTVWGTVKTYSPLN